MHKNKITSQEIKSICERHFDVRLSTKKRSEKFTYPRFVYYKLCRVHTLETYHSIGGVIEFDHATAVHGARTFEKLVAQKEFRPLKKAYDYLNEEIKVYLYSKKKKSSALEVEYRIRLFKIIEKHHHIHKKQQRRIKELEDQLCEMRACSSY